MSIPIPQGAMTVSDAELYSGNMSFSSSPHSSQFSPTLSSPTTPVCLSSSPQDSGFWGPPRQMSDACSVQPQPQPQPQPQRGFQSDKRGVSTFIGKLYRMVNDTKHQDLIAWNSAGASFLITNSKLFSQQVLPEYFKHGNFSSFVRQLNMYGFRKINKAPRTKRGVQAHDEVWEFSHPKFQREWPDMLCEIKRKAVESDVLRRETGDMQACFSMVQQSQDSLLEQFRILQDNFSTMLRGFEDLKKGQMQIQIGIQRLSQYDNTRYDVKATDGPPAVALSSHPPFREQQHAVYIKAEDQHPQYSNHPSVFVTTPTNNTYQHQQYPPHPQFYVPQDNYFLDAVNTPLPPSPLSSQSLASSNISSSQ